MAPSAARRRAGPALMRVSLIVFPFLIALLIAGAAYLAGASPLPVGAERELFQQDNDDGGADDLLQPQQPQQQQQQQQQQQREGFFLLPGDSNSNEYYLTERGRLEPDDYGGHKQYYTAWPWTGSNSKWSSSGGSNGGGGGGGVVPGGAGGGGGGSGSNNAVDSRTVSAGYMYDCPCAGAAGFGASNGRDDREFAIHLVKAGFYRKTARAFREAGGAEPERYMAAAVARYRCGCFRLDDVAQYAIDTLEAERRGLITAAGMPPVPAGLSNVNYPSVGGGSNSCAGCCAGSNYVAGGGGGGGKVSAVTGPDIVRRSVEAVFSILAKGYDGLVGGSNAASSGVFSGRAVDLAEAAVRTGRTSLRELWRQLQGGQGAAATVEGFEDGLGGGGGGGGGGGAAVGPAAYHRSVAFGTDPRGNEAVERRLAGAADEAWRTAAAELAAAGADDGGGVHAAAAAAAAAAVSPPRSGRPLAFPFPHAEDPLASPQYRQAGDARAKVESAYRAVFGAAPTETVSGMLVERYDAWGGDMRRIANLLSTLYAISAAEEDDNGDDGAAHNGEAAKREALRAIRGAAAALDSARSGGDAGEAAVGSGARALDDAAAFEREERDGGAGDGAARRPFSRPEVPWRGGLQAVVDDRQFGERVRRFALQQSSPSPSP